MIITTDLIKSLNPCKDRLDNFLTQHGHYWAGTHREFLALDNITYEDKRWVLSYLVMKINLGKTLLSIEELCSLLDKHETTLAKAKDAPMFQVGDIVEWCGVRGVVDNINDMLSSVQGKFGDTRKQTFTSDGKLCTWHIVPSLKLIERPKKKIKKYKVLFKKLDYINQFQVSGDHYADREDFESRVYSNQFIQLIKESEIEVEE